MVYPIWCVVVVWCEMVRRDKRRVVICNNIIFIIWWRYLVMERGCLKCDFLSLLNKIYINTWIIVLILVKYCYSLSQIRFSWCVMRECRFHVFLSVQISRLTLFKNNKQNVFYTLIILFFQSWNSTDFFYFKLYV